MKRKMSLLVLVLVLGGGFLLMQLLLGMKKELPKKEPLPRKKVVETQTVSLSDIQTEIVAYGRMASSQPVTLYSEVSGTLERGNLPFKPGQRFKRGDLLLRIDDRQVKLDINTAKSDLLNALARVLPEIRVDFSGEFETWQKYFNSCRFDCRLPDLPKAANPKIRLYLSRFNVYKIYFSIRNLEILHEKHKIEAPFDGSVVSAELRAGSNARSGTRLGEIISLENPEVEVPVPVEDLLWIDREKPVTLTSSEVPGRWSGTIARIGNTIDTRTQTAQVYIAVNDSSEEILFDGVFLEAFIPGRIISRAVRIPRKALYEDRYVYIVSSGRLEYRPVRVARRETDSVIVSEGVRNGEILVTEVLQGVSPGMLAEPKPAEEAGAAGR